MTLEEVLNRAGQMNRAERWTLWTACGTHQLDSLPRTETGGAKRPRYCPRCWTAFSADGVLWNPPCLPDEMGCERWAIYSTARTSDAGRLRASFGVSHRVRAKSASPLAFGLRRGKTDTEAVQLVEADVEAWIRQRRFAN